MDAGSLYGRCARCANRCLVRLAANEQGVVVEAYRRVPGPRGTLRQECPNLSRNVGLSLAEVSDGNLIEQKSSRAPGIS